MQILTFILDYLGLIILVIAIFSGMFIKRARKKYLTRKEAELAYLTPCNLKKIPEGWDCQNATLVCGSVVIANNMFRSFLAGFRNIFGGEVKSYRVLLDHARRIATVRMLEKAKAENATIVWNVRIETSTLQGKKQNACGGVEIMVYGTAMQKNG
jgi:uncharacterized protein YbjQ (UPF0145 family)